MSRQWDDVDEANYNYAKKEAEQLKDIFYDVCAKLEKDGLLSHLTPEAAKWWKAEDEAGARAVERFKKDGCLYGEDQKRAAKYIKRKMP